MSEPMIIIEPCAGLGNRLLGLGSAYAVAEKLNRRLVVMWKREVGCNIRFSELFDLPFEVVEISENGFKKCIRDRDLRMSRWHSFLGIMQKRNGEKWQIVS